MREREATGQARCAVTGDISEPGVPGSGGLPGLPEAPQVNGAPRVPGVPGIEDPARLGTWIRGSGGSLGAGELRGPVEDNI